MSNDEIRFSGVRWNDVKKPVSIWHFHWPLIIMGLLIIANIYDPPENIPMLSPIVFLVCSIAVLINLPRFIRRNIIGFPLYLWLNEETLEIHHDDWWILERQKAVPRGQILKIWLGGWFRRDVVLESGVSAWTIRADFNWYTGRLQRLRLRDTDGNSFCMGGLLEVVNKDRIVTSFSWNKVVIAQILRMLAVHCFVHSAIDCAGKSGEGSSEVK